MVPAIRLLCFRNRCVGQVVAQRSGGIPDHGLKKLGQHRYVHDTSYWLVYPMSNDLISSVK